MRCSRCGKNFDGEMYSGICPKCGHFNNRQQEYDVSKYYSAKFDDGGKVSTSAQAAKQHEQLHRAYDSSDMHKSGAGQHEKLHQMYDKYNMHRQTGTSAAGTQQTRNYQAGVPLGKTNPYQRAGTNVQGGAYQAKQNGSHQQGSSPQGSGSGQAQYRPANLNGGTERKNIVAQICIVAAVFAVLITVLLVQIKKSSLIKAYNTLDYEQQYAGVGEVFEIDGRLLLVEKAEVIDTSEWPELAVGEKLAAVTVEILPAGGSGGSGMSGTVYVSDGYSCKQYLDSNVVRKYLDVKDVLTGYNYLDARVTDGMTGRFYFFVDEGAEEITISFDEDKEKDTIFILQKRVSVTLQLEEEKP